MSIRRIITPSDAPDMAGRSTVLKPAVLGVGEQRRKVATGGIQPGPAQMVVEPERRVGHPDRRPHRQQRLLHPFPGPADQPDRPLVRGAEPVPTGQVDRPMTRYSGQKPTAAVTSRMTATTASTGITAKRRLIR